MAQGVKLSEDVLPVEQLKAWREEGLSFDAIGERVGYSGGTVGTYAKRVLPPELCGRQTGRKKARVKQADDPQARLERIKAELKAAREKAEARKRQELVEKADRSDPKKREEEEKHPVVAVPQETIEIAPLPDLQEGLFIAAGANGTAAALVTGPGGLQDLLAQQQAHAAWCEFLGLIAPGGELDGLARMTPPRYVHTDADRWEHLRQIAAGYVVAGRRLRRLARRIVAAEGQSTVSRSTARGLELLARAARWLIAREREQ